MMIYRWKKKRNELIMYIFQIISWFSSCPLSLWNKAKLIRLYFPSEARFQMSTYTNIYYVYRIELWGTCTVGSILPIFLIRYAWYCQFWYHNYRVNTITDFDICNHDQSYPTRTYARKSVEKHKEFIRML